MLTPFVFRSAGTWIFPSALYHRVEKNNWKEQVSNRGPFALEATAPTTRPRLLRLLGSYLSCSKKPENPVLRISLASFFVFVFCDRFFFFTLIFRRKRPKRPKRPQKPRKKIIKGLRNFITTFCSLFLVRAEADS